MAITFNDLKRRAVELYDARVAAISAANRLPRDSEEFKAAHEAACALPKIAQERDVAISVAESANRQAPRQYLYYVRGVLTSEEHARFSFGLKITAAP